MKNSKNITESKTIQASIVGAIMGVLVLLREFGVEIDLDEGSITEIVGAFIILISAGIAIYGRIVAKTLIK